MNIVIPMGGIGHRFASEGYRFPKPLVKIVGRPMLFWLLDHLDTKAEDIIYIGVSESLEQQFGLMEMLRIEYPSKTFREVILGFPTRGAAETLFIILQSMTNDRLKCKTISLDCDTIYFKSIIDEFRQLPAHLNASFYFEDDGEKPIYSYISFAEEETIQMPSKSYPSIVDVREKIMISKHANTGAYAFASASILKQYCAMVLDQPVGLAGEYYTTSVIKMMLKSKETFVGIHVPTDDFVCVGTPAQMEVFLKNLKTKSIQERLEQTTNRERRRAFRQMRFCFDLDNTLVSYPSRRGDYTSVKPKSDNIRLVRELYDAGHYIIIQTARRMKTHGGNVGAVIADIGLITLETLKKFDIPYHELLFGKPYADIYVDDLAVHALIDTAKEIGWYTHSEEEISIFNSNQTSSATANQPPSSQKKDKSFIVPRHFNTIQRLGKLIIKSGPTENLNGEIFFYQHIPKTLEDLFPRLENVILNSSDDDEIIPRSSIVLERIEGITYSHLFTNFCLTPGRLVKMLMSLKRMHDTTGDGESVDIYANYAGKVRSRYEQYGEIYRTIEELSNQTVIDGCPLVTNDLLMNEIASYFDNYAMNHRGKHSQIIHGDPVFTNVLLTSDNQVKFLDMRGSLGDRLTLQGDVNYDLSKVYQSLTGYDFILHDKLNPIINSDRRMIYENYVKELRQSFIDYISQEYPHVDMKDIHMITIQLYFTLIPLHNNIQHQVQFLNMAKKLYHDFQM